MFAAMALVASTTGTPLPPPVVQERAVPLVPLVASTLIVQAAMAPERAGLAASVAVLQRLAEPHLRVRPTDTPEVLKQRWRLARLMEATTRCAAACDAPQPRREEAWFSLLYLVRDLCDEGSRLSSRVGEPGGPLAWWHAGLRLTEKLVPFVAALDRLGFPVRPAQRPDLPTYVDFYRSQIGCAFLECFAPRPFPTLW